MILNGVQSMSGVLCALTPAVAGFALLAGFAGCGGADGARAEEASGGFPVERVVRAEARSEVLTAIGRVEALGGGDYRVELRIPDPTDKAFPQGRLAPGRTLRAQIQAPTMGGGRIVASGAVLSRSEEAGGPQAIVNLRFQYAARVLDEMLIEARFPEERLRAYAVPIAALLSPAGEALYVTALREGRAQRIAVRSIGLDPRDGRALVVNRFPEPALRDGEVLAAVALERILDGEAVRISSEETQASAEEVAE